MVTPRVTTKEVERQDAYYMLTDGVQVVLSKRIRRTDQDWSKCLPTYKSFIAFSWEYQTNLEAESLPLREQKRYQ